jgi:hypothetical protein
MHAENLHSGITFPRNGIEWIIVRDDGQPQRFSDGDHVARLICEPRPRS